MGDEQQNTGKEQVMSRIRYLPVKPTIGNLDLG